MKILIVNAHLETGGIRQSLLNLLDNVKSDELEIDLQLLRYDENKIKQYEQLKDVNLCPPLRVLNIYKTPLPELKGVPDKLLKMVLWGLSKVMGEKRLMKIMLFFTRKTKNYDVAISFSNDIWSPHVGGFFGGCNDYVLKKVNAKRKVGWIHNDPYKLGLTSDICKKTYNNFDLIVNVSYACKTMFDEIIPEYKYKSNVVYNMFDIKKVQKLSEVCSPYNSDDKFKIVTVARLANKQKRIDRIVACCEKLKNEGITNFSWHIIGDGPDKDWLTSLAKEKGVEELIVFEGQKANPYPYMKYADVTILTSDYEAYGMVITESFIVGTPVISTNFPAAKEVISNGRNGLIVGMSVPEISESIKRIMEKPDILINMKDFIIFNEPDNKLALKQFSKIIKEN